MHQSKLSAFFTPSGQPSRRSCVPSAPVPAPTSPSSPAPSQQAPCKRRRDSEAESVVRDVRPRRTQAESRPYRVPDVPVTNEVDQGAEDDDGYRSPSDDDEEEEDLAVPEEKDRMVVPFRLPLLLGTIPRDTTSVSCSIFKHMCEKILLRKFHKHVIEYFDRCTIAAIWAYAQNLIQSNRGLRRVLEDGLWNDHDALRGIAGRAETYAGSGWYLELTFEPHNATHLKQYIGQSKTVKSRVRNHKRGMINGGSMHYDVGGSNGRKQTYVLLGGYREGSCVPLCGALKDLMEMYFCLLFQCLPKSYLRDWLPAPVVSRKETTLNSALPLHQSSGRPHDAIYGAQRISESDDPEVRDHWQQGRLRGLRRGKEVMRVEGNVALSRARRKGGWKNKIMRGPTPGVSFEQNIQVQCTKCSAVITDPAPLFLTADGKYVIRSIRCLTCPVQVVDEAVGKTKHRLSYYKPVDNRASVMNSKLKKEDYDLGNEESDTS